jgi:2-dehydro-3-deoxy-phosphogluconate/2-dehydro-3-deoxy-6-phosphogalactonate aldolase
MQKIIVPVITPFDTSGKVDTEKLKKHVSNLLEKGVDAIFLAGTTGLGPMLSFREKKEMLDALCGVTQKIIFQIGELNLENVLTLAKEAKDYSIIGVASYPPYYFPNLPEKWVLSYYEKIYAAYEHPIYVYNYPLATGFNVTPSVLKQLGENVVKGIKNTMNDLAQSLEYKYLLPKLEVYTGSDTLIVSSFASALDGVVSGAGNYVPHLLVKIRELLKEHKTQDALKVQSLVTKLTQLSKKYGSLSANYVLTEELMGYDVGVPREPIFSLDEQQRFSLKSEIRELIRENELAQSALFR